MKISFHSLTPIALSSLLFASPAFAESMLDEFNTDTSASYTLSDSFGFGGSFTVSDGTLNLTAESDNTVTVVSSTSSLGIGESYSIDLLNGPAGNGNSGGPDGQFVILTTSTGQPDGSSSFGFRLRVDDRSLIRLSTYSDGGNSTITTTTDPTVSPDTFWIDRTSATDFDFYYGDIGSRTLITSGSLLPSEVTDDLRVGVQAYSAPDGAEVWSYDNLQIQTSPMDLGPAITSFSASSEIITEPGPVIFTWSTVNEVSVTLDGMDVTGLAEQSINITESGDYLLEVTGADSSTVNRLITVTLISEVSMDDFEADTSASYAGSDSFGSGGSFTVSDGTLNLTAASDNTFSIVAAGSSLEIGESYSIDLLDGSAGSGISDGGDGVFLMLTTGAAQPNGISTFGFRLRIDGQPFIRLATYSDGGFTNEPTAIPDSVAPGTFWIDRITFTDFEFYYGESGSRSLIGTSSLLGSEITGPLRVGVQAYSGFGGTEEWNFDNLNIGTIPLPAPPPSFNLTITPSESTPGAYNFTWDSNEGERYEILSNVDLATLPDTWPIWNGNTDISAGAGSQTTLTVFLGAENRRFFAVREVQPEFWTIAGLGDTQVLIQTPAGREVFSTNTQWLADQKESLDLIFVSQLGDIVENGKHGRPTEPPSSTDNEVEWNGANEAMSNLDGVVGWGTVPGNHEYDWVDVIPGVTPTIAWLTPTPPSGLEAWKERFGPATTNRYLNMPEFGGAAANDVDTYFKYTAEGREFLHLHLQADVPDDSIVWAQSIVDANPGMPTIITTHVFEGTNFGPPNTPFLAGEGRNSADAIWEKLITDNSQIFMVLSGHTLQQQRQTRLNSAGEPVFTIVQDYAGADQGGNPAGYLRLYQFDEKNGMIYVKTYSPTLDTFLRGAQHEFNLTIDFDARLGPAVR